MVTSGRHLSGRHDCLPYAESTPRQGTAWPELLRCVEGTCQERAASVPPDLGQLCSPDRPLTLTGLVSVSGGPVVPGRRSNSLCDLYASAGTPTCTMQCAAHTDCPEGSVGRA